MSNVTSSYKGYNYPMKGIVTRIDDPSNLGRIQVYLPSYHGNINLSDSSIYSEYAGEGENVGRLPWAQICTLIFKDTTDCGKTSIGTKLLNKVTTAVSDTVSTVTGWFRKLFGLDSSSTDEESSSIEDRSGESSPIQYPSVGDIVWLTFEGGDIRCPVYMGSLVGDLDTQTVYTYAFNSDNPAATGTFSTLDMTGTYTGDAKDIWIALRSLGFSEEGTAAVMGNLQAESNLSSINAQDSYGYNDQWYTASVDNGTYTNFVKDGVGYGLAQWTYYTRKANLLSYAKQNGVSIGNTNMQINFLYNEIKGIPGIYNAVYKATDILAASNVMLHQFEAPADQSPRVEQYRASLGYKIYNTYKGTPLYASNTGSAPSMTFRWPVPDHYNISTYYGTSQSTNKCDGSSSVHKGIDISDNSISGAKVVASHAGTAVARNTGSSGYGYYVTVSHGSYVTIYAHLSKLGSELTLNKSITVRVGQTIGYVGMTGSANKACLHYEVKIDGNNVDPTKYVSK